MSTPAPAPSSRTPWSPTRPTASVGSACRGFTTAARRNWPGARRGARLAATSGCPRAIAPPRSWPGHWGSFCTTTRATSRSRRVSAMPDGALRIATWNVNSIRTRLPRVLDWLERAEVDVLAMQETKCSDEQFPTMPFLELGYEVAHVGFSQWNGVAIASRVGLDNVEVGFDGQPTWSSKPRADRGCGGSGRGGSAQPE